MAIERASESPTALILGGTCIDSGAPVSWWPGEGNNDDVAGTNPITLRSGGVAFEPGVVGQGFRFDQRLGEQPFMEIADSPDLRPANFTIDLWAQRFGAGQNNDDVGNILVLKAITDTPDSGVSYFLSWNNANKIVAGLFFEDGGDPVMLTSSSVHGFVDPDADPPDPFVHVALTYDGTTATLYVNGTAEDSDDAAGRSVAYGPGSVVVGDIFPFHRTRFPRSPNGIIDELEIFNYALAAGQIQEIYGTEGDCKLRYEPSPEVDIDIKPGSEDNPINLGAGGGKSGKGKGNGKGKRNANIPVAILTTNDFDASAVDVSTVTLGDDDDDEVGVIVKKNGTLQAALEDVDDDGDLDLVMHFSIADLVDSDDLNELTTRLCINGETLDGDAIHGCDSVTIVGGGDDND